MKTFMQSAETKSNKWYIVDATNMPLGRLASQVAAVLRGKNKPEFTPNELCGDHVIIINTDKVVLTGNKLNNKVYTRHSGYVGGLKEVKAKDMIARKPEQVIELAVKGMLPKNALGREMIKKLKVYSGAEHEHAAQKPEKLEIKA